MSTSSINISPESEVLSTELDNLNKNIALVSELYSEVKKIEQKQEELIVSLARLNSNLYLIKNELIKLTDIYNGF